MGQVLFGSEDIAQLPTHSAIGRKGIAVLPQAGGVFPELSVQANLLMGAYTVDSRTETLERLQSVYNRFPILNSRRSQRDGGLSGGLQMILSFGRALMSKPENHVVG